MIGYVVAAKCVVLMLVYLCLACLFCGLFSLFG